MMAQNPFTKLHFEPVALKVFPWASFVVRGLKIIRFGSRLGDIQTLMKQPRELLLPGGME